MVLNSFRAAHWLVRVTFSGLKAREAHSGMKQAAPQDNDSKRKTSIELLMEQNISELLTGLLSTTSQSSIQLAIQRYKKEIECDMRDSIRQEIEEEIREERKEMEDNHDEQLQSTIEETEECVRKQTIRDVLVEIERFKTKIERLKAL